MTAWWRMRQLVLRLWHEVSLYVPLMMVALTALGTYWLLRITPAAPTLAEARAVVHEPDYFMRGFSLKTFDANGRLKSELFGTEARHYADTDTLEIDDARIVSHPVAGSLTVATAARALANGNGSEVQLIGRAHIVRQPAAASSKGLANGAVAQRAGRRMEFRGEFLHVFLDTDQVRSHKPVEILHGDDRFTADTLEADNVELTLTLDGRVRSTLVPRLQTSTGN